MDLMRQLIQRELDLLPTSLIKQHKIEKDKGKQFSLLMLKKLSGYTESKLSSAFCEGGGDHNIDGVFLNDQGSKLQINVLSCQMGGSILKDKDITDLIENGLYYLINNKRVPSINATLRGIKEEVDEARTDSKQIFIVNLILISLSNDVVSHNGESALKRFQSDMQIAGVEFEYSKFNSKEVAFIFSSRKVPLPEIPIKLSGLLYYQFSGKEGFICRLPIKQITKIYLGFTDDSGIKHEAFGKRLFMDNIRTDLGLEKRINTNIYKTATDIKTSSDFEFFNNGITILYDDKKGNLNEDSPLIYVRGLQIVNGCQTVSTLVQAELDGKLCTNVYLTCKFIKKSVGDNFIQSVITYTNSQNAITERDMHSNDAIQYDIQTILLKDGVMYERKLNEYIDEPDEKRMDALDAAHSYLCCAMDQPHTAKQKKKQIFNELYKEIFDSSKPDLPYAMFVSMKIFSYVLQKRSESKKKKRRAKKLGKSTRQSIYDKVIAHGSFHISNIVYNKYYSNKTKDELHELTKNYSLPKDIEEVYSKAVKYVAKHIKHRKIHDMINYFKTAGAIRTSKF